MARRTRQSSQGAFEPASGYAGLWPLLGTCRALHCAGCTTRRSGAPRTMVCRAILGERDTFRVPRLRSRPPACNQPGRSSPCHPRVTTLIVRRWAAAGEPSAAQKAGVSRNSASGSAAGADPQNRRRVSSGPASEPIRVGGASFPSAALRNSGDAAYVALRASSRPKTALFGNLGVRLRISLCGVQEYASAQILIFLDLAQKSLVFASGTPLFPLEFPDGN